MEALEERTRALETRVAELEGRRPAPKAPPRPKAITRAAPAAAAARGTAPDTRARMGRPDGAALEDLVGGRVLAWVGGLAVLVGIVFLLAIAVSRGWIGEEARTVMAGGAPLRALRLGGGLFGHRRRPRAPPAPAPAGGAGPLSPI